MSITTVANMLNKIADEQKYSFRFIQHYRAHKNKKKPQTYNPFGAKTIFESDGYAYHTGGRHEIQYNIGHEKLNNGEGFRYGLAFSLEKGRSLVDPITQFQTRIRLFNEFVRLNSGYFRNILMWYCDENHVKHELNHVAEIPNSLLKINNFIFIGQVFDKPTNQISQSDVKIILKFFDYLLKLYQFVEPIKGNNVCKNKIARLCWNTNGWIKPSGRDGKSRSESHESDYGFGYEEWLFDLDKTIDGYHYGFLEPINKFISKYVGNRYNFLLYTINSLDSQKYWVGKINNVEVIDIFKASQITQTYLNNGWVDEMKSQLETARLNSSSMDRWMSAGELFNIRFKVKDIEKIYSIPFPITTNDPRISSYRYNLLDINTHAELPDEDSDNFFDINTGNDGNTPYSKAIIKKTFHVDIELEQKHNEMSNKFLKYLKDNYPNDIVKRECKSFGARRIDIVRKTPDGNIFYEIKTYTNPLISLRNALGQIFEYAFYPNHRKAIKLVIVTNMHADNNFKKYIEHLNTIVNTPIEYIHFDLENNTVVT